MFEDFDKSKASREGRGRMGVSFLISGGIFVGIAAALAAAIATARVVVRRQQRDVQVAFANLPRAPKPKPIVKAQPGRRKAAMPVARPPSAVPQQRPEEAEGELTEAGKVGPVEGFTDGEGSGAGGKGMSQQVTETIEEPRFLSGCRAPEIPDALTSTAATIEIDVRMLVDARGLVQSAEVLKSHPLVPNDVILAVRAGPGIQAGPPARRHAGPLPVPAALRVPARAGLSARKGPDPERTSGKPEKREKPSCTSI